MATLYIIIVIANFVNFIIIIVIVIVIAIAIMLIYYHLVDFVTTNYFIIC